MKTIEIVQLARQSISDVNYANLKHAVLSAKGNSKAIASISEIVREETDSLLHDSFYNNLSELLDAVQSSPKLKQTIFDLLPSDITYLLEENDFQNFKALFAMFEKYGYTNKTCLKEAIEEGVEAIFERECFDECPEILELAKSYPLLRAALENAIRKDYLRTRQNGGEGTTDLFPPLVDHPNFLQSIEPNGDIFYIPASQHTHEYPITIIFDRHSGFLTFQSGCLGRTSLEDLKKHWKRHEDDQRRERALPLVINSLKAIARGTFPKHATGIVVESSEKLSEHARKQLTDAGYQAPKFKGKMG